MGIFQKNVCDITDAWAILQDNEASGSLYHTLLQSTEKILINHAMMLSKNNKTKAASLLGISRVTLIKKISQ